MQESQKEAAQALPMHVQMPYQARQLLYKDLITICMKFLMYLKTVTGFCGVDIFIFLEWKVYEKFWVFPQRIWIFKGEAARMILFEHHFDKEELQ